MAKNYNKLSVSKCLVNIPLDEVVDDVLLLVPAALEGEEEGDAVVKKVLVTTNVVEDADWDGD